MKLNKVKVLENRLNNINNIKAKLVEDLLDTTAQAISKSLELSKEELLIEKQIKDINFNFYLRNGFFPDD